MPVGLNQVKTKKLSFNLKTTGTSNGSKEVVSAFSYFILSSSIIQMYVVRQN